MSEEDEVIPETFSTDCWGGCYDASDYNQPVSTADNEPVVKIVVADAAAEFPVCWKCKNVPDGTGPQGARTEVGMPREWSHWTH